MVTGKKILNFYINSSIHVALAVTAFTGVTMLNLELPPDADLLGFIFFGSVSGYNFVKYSRVSGFQHFSLNKNLRSIQVFSLLCGIAFIYYALKQPLSTLGVSTFFGVITALYALPVFSDNRNLRSLTGIKIFVIATVWAGVTVILPVLEAGFMYWPDLLVEFIQRLMFVVVLTLPFDIRDLRFDTKQLQTIPQLFGIRKTRILGISLLIAVVSAEFIKQTTDSADVMALLLIAIVTAVFIRKSVIQQARYYASFWVEGIPILWWFTLVIIEQFI